MLSPEVLSLLHNSTCAVGYITVPYSQFIADVKKPYYKVIGTGFVVEDGLIMTNRHVIQGLIAQQEDLGFTDNERLLLFVYPKQPSGWTVTIAVIRIMGLLQNENLDIGLIGFTPPKDPNFKKVQPLIPQPESQFRVTEEIAICGYPYGQSMLQKNGKVYRWGPIIQQGHISALSPYENTNHPTEIMLDVRIAPGMSGAPIIRPNNGQLIGIVHSAWEATTAVACPLDKKHLSDMLESHHTQLKKAQPAAQADAQGAESNGNPSSDAS